MTKRSNANSSASISVALDPQLRKAIDRAAKRRFLTVSAIVITAITNNPDVIDELAKLEREEASLSAAKDHGYPH